MTTSTQRHNRRSQLLPIILFALALLASACLVAPAQEADGRGSGVPTFALYYSPGMFAQVARLRGLPVSERMASVPDCSRLGQHVTAWINGHIDTYLVADCSGPADRLRHVRQGLVIEVNWAASRLYFPKGEGRAPAYIIGFSGRQR